MAVYGRATPFGDDTRAPHVESDEVGREPDDRLSRHRLPVLETFHADQPLQALLARPPEEPVLDKGTPESRVRG
jgi:hypothetical protein